MDVDEGLHDGTYNGAEGTFRCTGDAMCTISFNDKGKVDGAIGGWVFIPDKGATSDEPDYDYLNYGFWLEEDGGCRRRGHLQRGPDLRRFVVGLIKR